jgi:hypothetical protein
MEKKYFDTKKGSVEEKINKIASEQPTINATYTPDVKLSTEKKYFESKQGSLEELAGKLVSESFIKENTYAFDYNFELYMPGHTQRGDGDAIKEYEGTIKATGKDAAEAKPKAEKELQKRIDAAEKATKGTLEGESLGSGRAVSEGMDPVNKDAVRKKFDDRKDKDIDNDGDTDSTDKYLHKRRAAISKAVKEEAVAVYTDKKTRQVKSKKFKDETEAKDWFRKNDVAAGQITFKPDSLLKKEAVNQDDHGEKINQDKKDAAMKKTDQKKDFKSLRAETKIIKLGDKGKTDTGKTAAVIDVEPSAKPI